MRSILSVLSLLAFAAADDVVHFRTPEKFQTATLMDLHANPLQHYGHPPDGCEDDEAPLQIAGVPGMVCVPKCDSLGQCPTDVPAGVTAAPQCALENQQTGDKYCVLICHEEDHNNLRAGDAQCGDATCQIVQAGLGVCTYES